MKIEISSLENIQVAAKEFADRLGHARVIAFRGEMGAGKTTFIKALCHYLGVNDNVSSPTFSIVNEYHTEQGKHIYHFDFYRIDDIREAIDMGYHVYFESGNFCFIEWPEKIESLLPDEVLNVEITIEEDNSRSLAFA